MKILKKCLSLGLTAALAVSLVACGGSNSGSSNSGSGSSSGSSDSSGSAAETEETKDEGAEAAAPAGGDYKISVILKALDSEYWKIVQAGAEKAGEELGVSVTVVGPSNEQAYDEHNNMVETALGADYDAIIIAPLQPDATSNIVSSTNLPIFAIDSNFDSDKKISFVGTSNKDAAEVGGKAAVEAAKAAGWEEVTVIAIQGTQGDATSQARYDGYKAGAEAAGATFLEESANYFGKSDPATSGTIMEGIITNHPEGVAVICGHNDATVIAAAEAVAGNEAYANTIFCGFNGDRDACSAILGGQMNMSVIQDAYGMGYTAVEVAVKYLNGEKVDEFVPSGTGVVGGEGNTDPQERYDELSALIK